MKNNQKSKNTVKKFFVAGMTLAMSTAMFTGCDSANLTNNTTPTANNAEIVRAFDTVTKLNAGGEVLSQSAVLDGTNYDVTVITEDKVQKYTIDSSMTVIDQKEIEGTVDTSASDSVSSGSESSVVVTPEVPTTQVESALEKALNKAIELSGITKDSILSFDFDNDKYLGQASYEIEIKTDNAKYEYTLSATDLSVYESEIKLSSKKTDEATSYIEQSEAIKIALNAVGIDDQTLVSNFKFSENNSKNNKNYKIRFTFEDYDYEIRINAATSVIVKFEKEIKRSAILTQAVNSAITKEQAKTIATELIGVENLEIKKVKIDYENDMFIYEVEATSDGKEYEVEINAETGEVIDFDSDKILDDEFEYYYGEHYKNKENDKLKDKNIDEAKQAVIDFLQSEDILITSIEVEKENNEFFYEVEVKVSGEYKEYLVNSKTLEVTLITEEDEQDEENSHDKNHSDTEMTEEQALEIALEKFSVKKSEAKIKKISFNDNKDCIVKYSVNDIDYTVQINVKDGTVKNFEKKFG